MIFKTGDLVICVKERDIPEFIGTTWIIHEIRLSIILVTRSTPRPNNLSIDEFVFKFDEVVPITSLLRELI